MTDLLLDLPGPLAGLLVVVASVAVALGGLAVVRRRFRAEDLLAGNEVAGYVYAVVSGMYGVVLAFVLVAAWEDFGRAETHVEDEVSQLGTLFRDAGAFPEPARTNVREALAGYTRSVAEDEWPTMADGEASPRTLAAYERVWETYYALDPGGDRAAVFYEQSVDRLGQVAESRRSRMLSSRSGVPPLMWALLLGGGAVVVGLTYLLGSENPATHRISVAALAAVVSSGLFVTLALDHPFGAGITLSRRPYVELADQWAVAR